MAAVAAVAAISTKITTKAAVTIPKRGDTRLLKAACMFMTGAGAVEGVLTVGVEADAMAAEEARGRGLSVVACMATGSIGTDSGVELPPPSSAERS
ncbi:hypothetical protein [Leptothrix ochracea]|uniref:hypothetical protein n=1 Tax=Leptothrix ochracea TaxID=735331 RepID=UPI0034E26C1B